MRKQLHLHFNACSPQYSAETKCDELAPVSDDFIETLVTPKKVKKVCEAMETEKEAHRCALKILHCIFTKEELQNCNIAGTNNKKALDTHKLNSLKGRFLFAGHFY